MVLRTVFEHGPKILEPCEMSGIQAPVQTEVSRSLNNCVQYSAILCLYQRRANDQFTTPVRLVGGAGGAGGAGGEPEPTEDGSAA